MGAADAMTAWSVFCGLTAAAFSFGSLLVVRVLFGMGEGPLSSTINKLVNQWFPRREQASAVGVANVGTPLGGAIAGPIVGLIAVASGWRTSFIVIAVMGFARTALWTWFAADRPKEHRWISGAERSVIETDQVADMAVEEVPLATYLRRPAILATAFAFFGYGSAVLLPRLDSELSDNGKTSQRQEHEYCFGDTLAIGVHRFGAWWIPDRFHLSGDPQLALSGSRKIRVFPTVSPTRRYW